MKELQILYEDNHIIAINKGVSDIVQGDKTGDVSLDMKVKAFLKDKYQKPGNVFIGVVHRIDRPVSGVVLFAKTSKALSRLNRMFQEKSVRKFYRAIVKQKPHPEAGKLIHHLIRKPEKNKSFAHKKSVPGSKEAHLSYQTIGYSDNYYLIEVELHTGRHHQIRAQFSEMGWPIKGDLKYGFPRSNPNGGISLHAYRVVFMHPVKNEEIEITAPFPEQDIWLHFEYY